MIQSLYNRFALDCRMLKIQAANQNQLSVTLFIERLQQHWKENFAHRLAPLSRQRLEQLARAAVAEAQARGLENEDEIVTYADLCLVNGSGFASDLNSGEKNR